ncbi:MAG: hypothetical protein IJ282_05720 [Lachnospiraceae bacterium]|nr:hypothetical protein [Lachnospiraceae bacterium]
MKTKREKQNWDADFYADTMEHEEEKKMHSALNCEQGIFGNKYADGLNREKSVFDKGALFKTSREG